jgi:hypothetical protein
MMQLPPAAFNPLQNLAALYPPSKGADKSPIVGACVEIGAPNDRPAAAKLVGVLRLKRPKRSLSPAFTVLRRNLNRVATA